MLYINQANEIALRQIELRRSANAPTSPPQTKKKESADTDEVLSSTSTPCATRACVRGLMGFHARTQLGNSALNCSLWVKLRYRAGTMRVCHTKIDFSGNTVKVLIFLTDILAVTKVHDTRHTTHDTRHTHTQHTYAHAHAHAHTHDTEISFFIWPFDAAGEIDADGQAGLAANQSARGRLLLLGY
jgi:ABC-type nickel/cobalt efflux system permease component RcnA